MYLLAQGLVYTAKLCSKVGQYGSMLDSMKKVVGLGYPLTDDERNLLAHAYTINVSKLRSAWRMTKLKCSEESKIIESETAWPGAKDAAETRRIVRYQSYVSCSSFQVSLLFS